jgi:antitoxin (DNA-binding transcriptional repressor) of toxin-antitoxin stability system
VLFLAAMGKVRKDKLPGLLKLMRYGRESHRTKQAVSIVPTLIGIAIARMTPIVERAVQKLRKSPLTGSFQETMASLTVQLTPEMVAELQTVMPSDEARKAEVDAVVAGAWQRVRDAGLYVDNREGIVSEPTAVTRAVARGHVDALRRRCLKILDRVMPGGSNVERLNHRSLAGGDHKSVP